MSRSFDPRSCERSLFDALVDARATYGAKKPILEDQERKPLTYTDLIRASFALGRKIAAMTTEGERVGVMLPASAGAVVTFFALHAFGRTPAMLNFTAGIRNLKAACELAWAMGLTRAATPWWPWLPESLARRRPSASIRRTPASRARSRNWRMRWSRRVGS